MRKFNLGMRACGIFLLWAATAVALPAQTFKTLHRFDGTDGKKPSAGLVQGIDGNLYGTTYIGGTSTACFDGCGTVYKITPSGTLTTLHSFDGTDGSFVEAALVQGTDGQFYGTTESGGASSACFEGCGTVFKITPSGTLTTLHSFDGTDGEWPYAGLVQGTNGKFYGTTSGTVFEMTPSGTLTTLHSFDGTDGQWPQALVQGTDGKFYGTTAYGGANGYGTVFQITPSGTLTTLHSFDLTDGANPHAALVQGTDGNLYGTTYEGGANGYGSVFNVTPGGTLTTLYSFDTVENKHPHAALVQGTDGNFYGTTLEGRTIFTGTVFSLSVGLGPFVETQTTSGKVGKAVKILGTNLTGATSVTFNGTAATFTVISRSFIKTSVPVGATTGTVQVVTPGGTLSSNVPFTVN
jgi:uncharacterized repeat protein (TIGR03803 family)